MSNVPFGWCQDEFHDKCIVSFPGHQCMCDCHQVTA